MTFSAGWHNLIPRVYFTRWPLYSELQILNLHQSFWGQWRMCYREVWRIGWRDSSAEKVLAAQVWGPESRPRTHRKSLASCVLVNPVLGRQRRGRCAGLPGQLCKPTCELKPVMCPCLKKQDAWCLRNDRRCWPYILTYTYMCIDTRTRTHTSMVEDLRPETFLHPWTSASWLYCSWLMLPRHIFSFLHQEGPVLIYCSWNHSTSQWLTQP